MQPRLLAVNLNGMIPGGDRTGRKIIPLGTGESELAMLQILARSGWHGPIGILGHTEEDAELKLRKELDGLQRLAPRLTLPTDLSTLRVAPAPPPPPAPAPARPSASLGPPGEPFVPGKFGRALDTRVRALLTAGKPDFRRPGLLIEARVRLGSRENFNVLVASEAKSSPTHWELYSYAGTGELSFYLPGALPAEIKSGVDVADGRWHHVAALYKPDEIQLFVDGAQVHRQAIRRTADAEGGAAQFAIGRLVEGGLGCDGFVESVRLARSPRPSGNAGAEALTPNAATLGFFAFETVNDFDGWSTLATTVPPTGPTRPRDASADAPRKINRDEPWKQGEDDWVDDRWNRTVPGRWQAYYLPTPTGSVRKGLVVRLGDAADAAVCYDTATGNWRAVWTGGFLRFDAARFGLINAPRIAGELRLALPDGLGWKGGDFLWRGFETVGHRLLLEYAVADVVIREQPWAVTREGRTTFARDLEIAPSPATRISLPLLDGDPAHAVAGELGGRPWFGFQDGDTLRAVLLEPASAAQIVRGPENRPELTLEPRPHPLRLRLVFHSGPRPDLDALPDTLPLFGPLTTFADHSGDARAPRPTPEPAPISVRGQPGSGTGAYVIDTIPVPYDNPANALMFCSGVGFFDDGDAAVATIHGDVWRVGGLDARLAHVTWRRIASGLFQPLGLTVVSNQPVVLCRDRLVRLVDHDGDALTDRYESLSSLIDTSAGGHDYVTSLCRDDAGNFYYVDPRGAHRISPDGRRRETISRGFRNPNGMGVSPDGNIVLVAPQQGEWTPSSVIHELRPDGWYGYPGPRVTPERPLGYDLPLCWIPHRIDNSSGSEVWAPAADPRFGPLAGHILHLSWGRCTALLTLRDVVDGVPQGAVFPLEGRFLSGPLRGAFNPKDGQLYVVGCQGWQTAAARDGSFQRLRYTGRKLALPVAWQAHVGSLRLEFNEPLDRETAEDPGSYALTAWNYKYAAQYGSKEWSVKHPDREGTDPWEVTSAKLLPDGRTVVLTVPDLGPVMQFALKFNLDTAARAPAAGELYGTIHRLHRP
jgi:hypothetical protein